MEIFGIAHIEACVDVSDDGVYCDSECVYLHENDGECLLYDIALDGDDCTDDMIFQRCGQCVKEFV